MKKVNYAGYELDASSKDLLMSIFAPRYDNVIAHHITTQFGSDATLPEDANIFVVGYADSKDGIEVLVCEVNGTHIRPDGSFYHITWSLEGEYKPVDSNLLLMHGWHDLFLDVPIRGVPKLF